MRSSLSRGGARKGGGVEKQTHYPSGARPLCNMTGFVTQVSNVIKCLIQSSTPQSLCDRFCFAPILHRLSISQASLTFCVRLARIAPARGAFSQANSKNPPLAGEVPDRAEG